MTTTIKLPAGLTFSDIRPGTPPAAIAALNAFLASAGIPAVQVGDSNPLFGKILDFTNGGSPWDKPEDMAEPAYCRGIRNFKHIDAVYIPLIVDVGGDIYGMRVDFEIADPTADIPASFPMRTYEEPVDPADPESAMNQFTYKWNNWGNRPDMAPVEIEGKWYRDNRVPGRYDDGQQRGHYLPLPASVWVSAGLTPVQRPEPTLGV